MDWKCSEKLHIANVKITLTLLTTPKNKLSQKVKDCSSLVSDFAILITCHFNGVAYHLKKINPHCTISILVWCHSPSHQLHLLHSLTQSACRPTSADHEVIASVTGPSVNAGTVTAVINVKGTTPTSTAPFVPPNHMSSTPKQLPHLGTNASSIEVVYRSPKATGHSITGAFQQDLVSPFKVTLTSADKLQQELCFHPNQRRVDFVISGTTGGFFFLALILWQCHWGLRPRTCHQQHFTLPWLISISSQNFRKVM